MYYHADGTPRKQPQDDIFWAASSFDKYIFSNYDHYLPLELSALRLIDLIGCKIFENREDYHQALQRSNPLNSQLGLDSDVRGSKEDFEQWVKTADTIELKLLYYYDVSNIVGSIQDNVIRVEQLLGEFYKELNMTNFVLHPGVFKDRVIHASGSIVTKIFSYVNYIFIVLASLLDYIAKLVYEFENLKLEFERYSRIKSSKILFGDAGKLTINGVKGTVFDGDADIQKLIILRNEIIHNGTFEMHPHVYLNLKGEKPIEKYILFPDFDGGIIKAFGSRKRFYENDTKLNLMLPEFSGGILLKVKGTIDELLKTEMPNSGT